MSTITLQAPLPTPAYRLTRRGRLVVFVLGLLVAFAVGVMFASGSFALPDAGPEQTTTVLVTPGDTLWGIASEAAGTGDVRDMMQRIEELNSLDSSLLGTGQRLLVPAE